METKDIKKAVPAYSGGLDTSIIIPWLEENYNNCEVVAVSVDVGQGIELDGLEEKAIEIGASKLYILDSRDEFMGDYTYPCLGANAIYEDVYLLDTASARPLIGQKLVEIAKQKEVDVTCHDYTGKGNDQVRFELAVRASASNMPIIAPWRTRELKPRNDKINYAEAYNISLKISRGTSYPKDKNLWHLSHEGLDLEDLMNEPQYDDIPETGVTPEQVPDTPTYIILTFEKGTPIALNGEKLGGQAMVTELNKIGGTNGIGIIGMVENRLVGMKSRGVYEIPGGTILYKAHQWLEPIYLDKEAMHYRQGVGVKFGEVLCNGQWFTPLCEVLSVFADKTSKTVSGEVKIRLYKGNLTPASISPPYILYSEQIASFGEDDSYDQNDSVGFINLYGLPIKVRAIMDKRRKK